MDFEIKLIGDDVVNSIDIFKLILSPFLGYYIKFLFDKIFNFYWSKNEINSISYILLPPTGFIITSIISDDIALSLGLVGALSIVRFRTPVKNPLELVNYFILITIGIVLGVSLTTTIFFILYLGPVLMVTKKYVVRDFGTSSELITKQSSFHTLRINVKNDLSFGEKTMEDNMIYFNKTQEGGSVYTLVFNNLEETDTFINSLEKELIIEYTIEKNQFN